MNDPSHAVGLWLEGDNFMVRFPDQQLVTIPVAEPGRLINVLRSRAEAALRKAPRTIGTNSAPVQYDLDKVRRFEDRKTKKRLEKAQVALIVSELLAEAGL